MAKKKAKKSDSKKKKDIKKKKDVRKKKDIKKKKNSKKKKEVKKKKGTKKDLRASDLKGKKSLKNKKKGGKKKVEKKRAVWRKEVSRIQAPSVLVTPEPDPVEVADHSSNHNVKEALVKLKSLESKEEVMAFTEGETRLTIVRALPAVLARLEKQAP